MSKTLRDLRRFVLANDTDDERHEIRAYVLEHATDIAEAIGVSTASIHAGLEKVADDRELARRLLAQIKQVERDGRDLRGQQRLLAAQASADVLGAAAHWCGDSAVIDIVSFLFMLTKRDHQLVFQSASFTVAVSMASLLDVARLERMDLTAFVDVHGLHIRWGGGTGGLNLRHRVDQVAAKIVVHLSARGEVAA